MKKHKQQSLTLCLLFAIVLLTMHSSCKKNKEDSPLPDKDPRDILVANYSGTFVRITKNSEKPTLNTEDATSKDSTVVKVEKAPNDSTKTKLLIYEKNKGAIDFSAIINKAVLISNTSEEYEFIIPLDTFFFDGGYIVRQGLNSYNNTGKPDGTYKNNVLTYGYRNQQFLPTYGGAGVPLEVTYTVYK